MPIERFKDAYSNWRYNPFTAADMAVDKTEDHLFIPGSSPFLIQMLEVPRKNTPTTVLVYCYDDLGSFTEVATAPAQGEFRVDYPPADGEGTGLIEFNQNDASKEVKVDYKATGSPIMEEFLDTKVSYPASDPVDNQIIAFVSGSPAWKYNPICYFHEGPVIYHASGEDESCLLFRFKRSADIKTVKLELKGAKLHQGYYTELTEHLHAAGTLAGSQPTHTHGVAGTTATGGSGSGHTHSAGTLAGSQPNHTHGNTGTQSANHIHDLNDHRHSYNSPLGGSWNDTLGPDPSETLGMSASHVHPVGNGGNDAVSISGDTAEAGEGASHTHGISLTSAAGGNDAVTVAGSTANAGGSPKTYGDSHKVYINGIDKTAEVLALTALTEFGNGTAGHAFITTGSGEMDISSLVSAAQFHELKITEPTAAKGGRVLCHLELF